MKRILALLLSMLVFAVSLGGAVFAEGEGESVYIKTEASLVQGNTYYCYVYVTSMSNVAALDISVFYDSECIKTGSAYNRMKLSSADIYNFGLADGEVRANYLLSDGIDTDGTGDILLFYFTYTVQSNAPVGKTIFDVAVNGAYDAEQNSLDFSGKQCTAKITAKETPKTCSVYADKSKVLTSVAREFTLNYSLSTTQVAAGDVEINYDSELFEVADASLGKALNGTISDINTELGGAVKLSFVSDSNLKSTSLFSVTFRTRLNRAESSEIVLKSSGFCNEALETVVCKDSKVAVQIAYDDNYVLDAPKLRTIAGYNSESGQMTVSLEIEENSHLAAGDFVIGFDPSRMRYISSKIPGTDISGVNETKSESGELALWVVFANEELSEKQTLASFVFDVTAPCEHAPIEITLSVKNASSSNYNEIKLNTIGTGAETTGHTAGNWEEDSEYIIRKCTVCGTELERDLPDDENLKVTNHSCSFNNNLTLNYYVPLSSMAGYSNIRLVVENDVYDKAGQKTTVTSTLTGSNAQSGDVGYLKFAFSGIAAAQLGSDIRARLYAEKDGVKKAGPVDDYNLVTYAYNRLKKSANDKYKTLIVDLLNYCSAAQVYFGICTDSLVNGNLTEEQKLFASAMPEISSITREEDKVSNPTASIKGKSLVFDNKIILKVYMDLSKAEDKSKTVLNMKLAGNGEIYSVPFSALDERSDGAYSARFDKIAPAEFRNEIKLWISADGADISNTYVYSIESYIASRLQKSTDENFKELMRETIKYADSAKVYFEK